MIAEDLLPPVPGTCRDHGTAILNCAAAGSELGRPLDRQPAGSRPAQARYLRIWDAPPGTGKSAAIMMGSFMIRRSFGAGAPQP